MLEAHEFALLELCLDLLFLGFEILTVLLLLLAVHLEQLKVFLDWVDSYLAVLQLFKRLLQLNNLREYWVVLVKLGMSSQLQVKEKDCQVVGKHAHLEVVVLPVPLALLFAPLQFLILVASLLDFLHDVDEFRPALLHLAGKLILVHERDLRLAYLK